MSMEQGGCTSRSWQNDQLVTCQLEPHANGVHLSRVDVEGGQELVQWTEREAVQDREQEQDGTPVWYGVLPVGQEVIVGYRDDRDRLVGTLAGAVLDDHEQLSAVMVEYPAGGGLPQRRAMVPFDNIAVMSWELPR